MGSNYGGAALIATALAVGATPVAAQSVYRAGSPEPYWRIAIDARTIRFEEPGRRPIVVPRPIAKIGPGGDRFVAKGLVVDTTRAHCSLGDSDRVYRDMVIVEVGGRTLRGCGNGATGAQINAMRVPAAPPPARAAQVAATARSAPSRPAPLAVRPPAAQPPAAVRPVPVPPPPSPPPPPGGPLELGKTRPVLANTQWTVWKVREQEIREPRPLTVAFSATQVEGQLCNRFRGAYTLSGERLQAPAIAATRMACHGPAMAAETLFFALLRQATRATISKWGTLTLSNGRDTVMLRPAPR